MPGEYHLRRQDREITDPEWIESIIRRGRFATIGLVDGDAPYVVTLSYGYDADTQRLYFHSAHSGHKLDVIAANPRACATIVIEQGYMESCCEHPFETVVLRGAMRLITDAEEKLHAIHTMVNHLESDPAGYWLSRSWSLDDRIGGFTTLALEIESVSAKQGS